MFHRGIDQDRDTARVRTSPEASDVNSVIGEACMLAATYSRPALSWSMAI